VFCSESIECLPFIASRFSPKLFVTISVAPIMTGIIVHFRFHIRCISIPKLMYFTFFSASFARQFCLGVLPHLSVCMFSLFVFIYYYYYLLTAIEFSLGGSSPHISSDKTNKNNYTYTIQHKNTVQTIQNTIKKCKTP
jgi:hypothetical protein